MSLSPPNLFDCSRPLRLLDIATFGLPSRSSTDRFADFLPELETFEHPYLFISSPATTTTTTIFGAISQQTLLKIAAYPALHSTPLEQFVEFYPTSLKGHSSIPLERSVDSLNTLIAEPLHIIEDPEGAPIGYLCTHHLDRLTQRAWLSENSVERLMQNPWIEKIRHISRTMHNTVFVVGGWVHDFLLGRTSLDLDFAVEGDVIALTTELAKQFGGEVHQFKHFGGAHWIVSPELTLDFTTARKERYPTFASLPIVSPTHIDEDLKRRDFNINAMALALHDSQFGLLIDPFSGREALQEGSISLLHPLSLLQDPTRIFRASRYASRFNFQFNVTKQQISALHTIEIPKQLSLQRIGIELEKIFAEDHPTHCFEFLVSWGIWTHWQPKWNLRLWRQSILTSTVLSEEWSDIWWLQLGLALCNSERLSWIDVISTRQHGRKLWLEILPKIERTVQGLKQLDLSLSDNAFPIKVGTLLQKSTLVECIVLEHLLTQETYRTQMDALQWWLSEGSTRKAHTTGSQLIAWGVPKGPAFAELLQLAQQVAWQGGDAEAEREALFATGIPTLQQIVDRTDN